MMKFTYSPIELRGPIKSTHLSLSLRLHVVHLHLQICFAAVDPQDIALVSRAVLDVF